MHKTLQTSFIHGSPPIGARIIDGLPGASVTKLLVAVADPLCIIYLRSSNRPKSEATSRHDYKPQYNNDVHKHHSKNACVFSQIIKFQEVIIQEVFTVITLCLRYKDVGLHKSYFVAYFKSVSFFCGQHITKYALTCMPLISSDFRAWNSFVPVILKIPFHDIIYMLVKSL